MIRSLLFFVLSGLCFATAKGEKQDEFLVLQADKQSPESLSFFVRHSPVEIPEKSDQAVRFEPLPNHITAHLSELGYLAGRQLFAVRYLSDTRLSQGNVGAIGFVLLCSVSSSPTRLVPIIADWEEEGATDDYSVSPVRQLNGVSFVWVRRDYSGNANFIGRMAVSAPDANSPLKAYPMFADTDALADLKKQGWNLWHRNNYFDEESLTWHYHLHRESKEASGKEQHPHRQIRVRYKFHEGKLHPEAPEEDE